MHSGAQGSRRAPAKHSRGTNLLHNFNEQGHLKRVLLVPATSLTWNAALLSLVCMMDDHACLPV